MGVATKPADNKNLQDLVPLNVLSKERFAAVSRKIVIEEVRKGRYLFKKGDRDNQSVYLLDGKISLIDGDGKVTDEVEANTDISRYPIANQQPRSLSARAVTRSVVARIDSGLLEVFLSWDQETGAEVTEITADNNKDWMTRILQSEVFENFPPAVIQRLLIQMKPFPVRAGQEVITEGAEGDYFYTIHQGECAVTRRASPGGEIIKLAELSEGDSFGEDALVTDNLRNATVTMLSDGVLMRLDKKDFAELLQKQLVKYVKFKEAVEMVEAGAVWIDVRPAAEYDAGAFEDSVNIPLPELRGELGELVFNAKYIMCCDTGHHSTSAAFLLSHKGFDVYVLHGGLNALAPADNPVSAGSSAETGPDGAGEAGQSAAQVIDFSRNQPDAADGAAAEQLEELATLHRENTELRETLDSYREAEQAFSSRQPEIDRLDHEVRDARAQLAALQERLEAEVGEAQLLRDQYAALQQEKHERVNRLEQNLGQSGERIDQLQTELEAGRQEAARLQALLDSGSREKQATLGQLEAELGQARQASEALHAERDAAREQATAFRAEVESAAQEHQQLLAQLRAELEQSRQQVTALESARDEQLAAGAHADSEKAMYVERLERGQRELEQSRAQVAELEAALAAAKHEGRSASERVAAEQATHAEALERQQGELEQSRAQVAELEAALAAATDESRAASERVAAEQAAHAEALEQRQAELEQSSERITELETAFEAAADEHRVVLEQTAAEQTAQAEMLEQLHAELEQSRTRVAELEAAFEAATEEQRAVIEQTAAEKTVQAEALELRQAELDESRAQVAELEAALEATTEEHRAAIEQIHAEKTEHAEALERLRERLSESRLEIDRLQDSADKAGHRNTELQQQLDELAARQEAEQAEQQERQAALQQELEAAGTARVDLEQQLVAMQQARDSTADRLTASEAALEESRMRLKELERESEAVRNEKQRLELQQTALEADIENLRADKQAAGDALVQLQGEWEAERNALREEIATANRRTEEHDNRLVEYQEAVQRERAGIEAGYESRLAALNGQLEQQEARVAQLQQEQAVQAQHYQAIVGERDAILVKLNESDRQCATRQQEIASLNQRLSVLNGSADERVQALSEQLEHGQQRIAEADQQAAERAARIESLLAELAKRGEENQEILAQAETLRQQNETLQQELLQTEERTRNNTQDNQEALNKAYEDLTRKNEIEAELQGQIERLRKKLEQSTQDLQAARNEARDSAEHFRDELNAERRARNEERVQLAARQKELKEQLAAIAHEHEEVLSSQEGVLARVRSAARDEERSRLQQLQTERLQQAEEQMVKLQAELKQAHEETARAVQQERDRLAADQTLASDQQAEADSAVTRLETQLKQLTQERDSALKEQRSVREQLNSLRAEVEVARGLMDADNDDSLEDTVRLRSELEESRKNIEIAVRLRTEAETQRDKALQAMEALHRGAGEEAAPETPLDIPSLDDVHPIMETRVARRQSTRPGGKPLVHAPATPPPATTPLPVGVSWAAGVDFGRAGKGIAALAVVAIAALVFWQAMQGQNPLAFVTLPLLDSLEQTLPDVVKPESVVQPAVETPIEPAPSRKQGTHSLSRQEVAAQDKVQDAGTVEKFPKVTALRSFRDRLKGGGLGPQMVELPGAAFLMGSAGTSMNFDERPQHRVELAGYAIGKHEVSFAEYDRFARATGRRRPYDEGWGRGDQPAINVSWNEARDYAGWLSAQTGHTYRLPTEAQWEFAARGGVSDAFWWEADLKAYPANCFDCGNTWDGRRTTTVGSFAANGFGLHDTAGNAQEWVEDCYSASYADAPVDGSARQIPRCSQRVVRGGAYSSPIDSLRSTRRAQYDQDTRLDNLGFRVVRVK